MAVPGAGRRCDGSGAALTEIPVRWNDFSLRFHHSDVVLNGKAERWSEVDVRWNESLVRWSDSDGVFPKVGVRWKDLSVRLWGF